MYLCEGQKWDLEHEVRKRDWEVLPIEYKKKIICQKIFFILKKNNQKIFTKDLICLRHEQQQHKTKRFFCNPFYLIFRFFVYL